MNIQFPHDFRYILSVLELNNRIQSGQLIQFAVIVIIIIANFSYQFLLIVFHWSLSDSKSPQVSWIHLSILLSILTALWPGWYQFFFWSPIPSVSFRSLWGPFYVQLVSLSPCFTAFTALWQDPSIWLSFRFLLFSVGGPLKQQNPLDNKIFFLSNQYEISSSSQGWVIHLYPKPLEDFMRLINSDLYIDHMLVWSNFNLLYNSQCINFPMLPGKCLNEIHSLVPSIRKFPSRSHFTVSSELRKFYLNLLFTRRCSISKRSFLKLLLSGSNFLLNVFHAFTTWVSK